MKIDVAPLVGARIEIHMSSAETPLQMSLPSWERGLKFGIPGFLYHLENVAPLVGARIEISHIAQ